MCGAHEWSLVSVGFKIHSFQRIVVRIFEIFAREVNSLCAVCNVVS